MSNFYKNQDVTVVRAANRGDVDPGQEWENRYLIRLKGGEKRVVPMSDITKVKVK